MNAVYRVLVAGAVRTQTARLSSVVDTNFTVYTPLYAANTAVLTTCQVCAPPISHASKLLVLGQKSRNETYSGCLSLSLIHI